MEGTGRAAHRQTSNREFAVPTDFLTALNHTNEIADRDDRLKEIRNVAIGMNRRHPETATSHFRSDLATDEQREVFQTLLEQLEQ